MCFYIHTDYPKAIIAEKDIECYKILRSDSDTDDLYSPFLYKTYFKKTDTHPKILKEFSLGIHDNEIHEGLHSYSNYSAADEKRIALLDWYDSAFSVHKCIIPAGTAYYYNPDHNQYVSKKLKIYKKNIKQ